MIILFAIVLYITCNRLKTKVKHDKYTDCNFNYYSGQTETANRILVCNICIATDLKKQSHSHLQNRPDLRCLLSHKIDGKYAFEDSSRGYLAMSGKTLSVIVGVIRIVGFLQRQRFSDENVPPSLNKGAYYSLHCYLPVTISAKPKISQPLSVSYIIRSPELETAWLLSILLGWLDRWMTVSYNKFIYLEYMDIWCTF